jgi:arylsulfatase A
VESPVWSLDILPTVCDAAGIAIPKKTDGISLLGDVPEGRTFFWRQGAKAALREGDLKIVRHRDGWELFDLKKDLSESKNIAGERPDIVGDLRAKWETLAAEMEEPLFR